MAHVVLTTYPSESNPNKVYEVCKDTSNNDRLWCRVGGTSGACTQWSVGWKRQGFNFHTCKHTRLAVSTLGMRTRVSDEFEYIVTAGITSATAVPTRPAAAVLDQLGRERSTRPRPVAVPSLEQVRRATTERKTTGIDVRTGRKRSDDE